MDRIEIRKDDNPIKFYHFNYGYFGNNTKLKLESVFPFDRSETDSLPGHTFEYYAAGSFPTLNSISQDYWGYYNGASNTSFIPTYKNKNYHVNTSSSVNREPLLNNSRVGTLKKVQYPTGGSTHFEYELHEHYDDNYQNTYVYEVMAENGTASQPDDSTTIFNVNQNTTATLTIQGNNGGASEGAYVELSKWDSASADFVEYSLPSLPSGNRRGLPAGLYRLYAYHADEGNGAVSIKIEYEQEESKNVTIGGLRIKKVIFEDPVSDQRTIKSFEYNLSTSDTSSGVLFVPPVFGGYITKYTGGELIGQHGLACAPGVTLQFLNVSTYTQLPSALYHGSHIGYSEVKEFSVSNTNPLLAEDNGMIAHFFINDKDNTGHSYPYIPTEDLSYKNGKKIKEVVYKREGRSLAKVREMENIYQEEKYANRSQGTSFKSVTSSFCYQCSPESYVHNSYNIYPTWHYLYQTINKEHDDDGRVKETITTYSYPEANPARTHHFSIAKQWKDSRGDSIKEEYGRVTANPALVNSIERFNNDVQVGGNRVSYLGRLPSSISFWDKGSDTYTIKIDYSFQGNHIIEAKEYPVLGATTGGLVKAYLWGYNNSYPIAEALNASNDEIYFEGFEENNGNAATNPRTGKQYRSGDYTVNFSPPNTKSYKIHYWYLDGSTWKPVLKDYTDTSMNLTEGSAIDDVRIYPIDAQMTTYTYDPGLGVTSQTSPNGITLYYEYDGFGRLHIVKDHQGNILKKHAYHYSK